MFYNQKLIIFVIILPTHMHIRFLKLILMQIWYFNIDDEHNDDDDDDNADDNYNFSLKHDEHLYLYGE